MQWAERSSMMSFVRGRVLLVGLAVWVGLTGCGSSSGGSAKSTSSRSSTSASSDSDSDSSSDSGSGSESESDSDTSTDPRLAGKPFKGNGYSVELPLGWAQTETPTPNAVRFTNETGTGLVEIIGPGTDDGASLDGKVVTILQQSQAIDTTSSRTVDVDGESGVTRSGTVTSEGVSSRANILAVRHAGQLYIIDSFSAQGDPAPAQEGQRLVLSLKFD
jgi:hypothetical protein